MHTDKYVRAVAENRLAEARPNHRWSGGSRELGEAATVMAAQHRPAISACAASGQEAAGTTGNQIRPPEGPALIYGQLSRSIP